MSLDKQEWLIFQKVLARTGDFSLRSSLYFSYPVYFIDTIPVDDQEQLYLLSWACRAALDYTLLYDFILDSPDKPNSLILLSSYLFQSEYLNVLSKLFLNDSSFWAYLKKYELLTLRGILSEKRRQLSPFQDISLKAYFQEASEKASLSVLAPIALANLHKQSDESLSHIFEWTTNLWNFAYQVNDDASDWRKDYAEKNISFPIAMALTEMGYDQLPTDANLPPVNSVAKVVYSNVLPKCFEEAQNSLEKAIFSIPEPLQASTWACMIKDLKAQIQQKSRVINEVIIRSKREKSRVDQIKKSSSGDELTNSIIAASEFIVGRQDSDGAWRDFQTNHGEAEFWTTGYIGAMIVETHPSMQKAIVRAKEFLLNHLKIHQGWGYHRYVGSDSDSTSWCLRFLHACGIPTSDLLPALNSLLAFQSDDGGFSTYKDHHALRETMRLPDSYDVSGWCSSHPCVSAATALVLSKIDPNSNSISKVVKYLQSLQSDHGYWPAYWYSQPYYSTSLALQALNENSTSTELKSVIQSGVRWLQDTQGISGGWGENNHDPHTVFSTALSISALLSVGITHDTLSIVAKGVTKLLESQEADGGWKPSAYMLMPDPSMHQPWEFTNWETSPYGFNTGRFDHRRLFTTATVLNALWNVKKCNLLAY